MAKNVLRGSNIVRYSTDEYKSNSAITPPERFPEAASPKIFAN
jgi:hypothetical protein